MMLYSARVKFPRPLTALLVAAAMFLAVGCAPTLSTGVHLGPGDSADLVIGGDRPHLTLRMPSSDGVRIRVEERGRPVEQVASQGTLSRTFDGPVSLWITNDSGKAIQLELEARDYSSFNLVTR